MGERFWPLSQPDFPKQFLSIFKNKALITQTLERLNGYFKKEEVLLVVPKELEKITRRFTRGERIIIEPYRKNTAPAIALAGMYILKKFGDGIIHVMPSDHLISEKRKFISHLEFGEALAKEGYLVTYGIKPTRVETGYGYIKIGREIARHKNILAFQGMGFTEKPDYSKAKLYIKSKRYLWNSGIFIFRIGNILDEIKCHLRVLYRQLSRYLKSKDERDFERIKGISIDYGVMEKSARLCVIKAEFNWDDVGSYLALERHFKKDSKMNIFVGDVKGLDTKASIVYSYNIPIKVLGIEDLVVVASPRGVLVCKKEEAPNIKKILQR